jgi:hypothetical protein
MFFKGEDTMKDLRISRRQVLQGVGAAGVLGALGAPTAVFADAGNETRVRWDLIIEGGPGLTPGGTDSALAVDGSQISMTGSGTFGPEGSAAVMGGGTWTTFDPTGATTGSGTYKVTRVVQRSVVLTAPVDSGPLPDNIGNPADRRGGVAVLRIAYSDGSQGVLTISCRFGAGQLPAVFEGITATKDVVGYVNQGPNHGFTIFHVIPPGH